MDNQIIDHWLTIEDLAQKKVSYGQNFEDVLLERVLPEPEGFFIDVGANDPVFHSVTKCFSEKGWRGIHIEPNPALVRRLRADRPGDVVVNAGVSDSPGVLPFFDVPEYHGWSTFLPEAAQSYRDKGVEVVEKQVPVTTLAAICEEYVDCTIDFLKIDVECFERQAILGADWKRWRPRVVVVESTWPEYWESLLLENDYRFAAFDGLNRYYVRPEDRDLIPLLAVPVNVLDNAVSYDYLHLIERYHHNMAEQFLSAREIGPTMFRLARRVREVAHRHPRLASIAKRMLRLTHGTHRASASTHAA